MSYSYVEADATPKDGSDATNFGSETDHTGEPPETAVLNTSKSNNNCFSALDDSSDSSSHSEDNNYGTCHVCHKLGRHLYQCDHCMELVHEGCMRLFGDNEELCLICRKKKSLALTARGTESSSESEDSEDVKLGSPEKGEAKEPETSESQTQSALSNEVKMTGKDDQSDSTGSSTKTEQTKGRSPKTRSEKKKKKLELERDEQKKGSAG